MVVKFYISMISGNKEMKKRQMKAQLIMESKGVDFRVIDICDPNCEADRRFMQKNAVPKPGARNAIPPQFFNDEEYCGDYDGFDEANEADCLEEFLKLPRGSLPQVPVINHNLSNFSSREVSLEKEIVITQVNGLSNSRETPEQLENPDSINQKEEDEDEYEEDSEVASEQGDNATFQGEPATDSLVVDEKSKEYAVAEQQSSNIEPYVKTQQNDSENSDEEAEVEHPDLKTADSVQEQQTSALSENLRASEQRIDTDSMTDARNTQHQQPAEHLSEAYSSDATTQSSSLKISDLVASDDTPRTQESLETDIVRYEREQALDADKEHDVNKKSIGSQDKQHEFEKVEQTRDEEHELVSRSKSEEAASSDVRPNELPSSSRPLSDAIQKHAIQDDSQEQQSSDFPADEQQQHQQQSAAKADAGNVERAKSLENDLASVSSGERVEPSNQKADEGNEEEEEEEEESEEEDEEDEEDEEEDEEEEEDEANKKIIAALPDEDDLMEMSTTVATAERFTEFSYKQLPGEA